MTSIGLSRMDSDITGPTFERVSDLVNEYARLVGRTHTEVAHALLSSNTLKKYGYTTSRRATLPRDRAGRRFC